MNYKQLREIQRQYDSYEGTENNRINKTGVAVEQFESVLNAAIYLAQENEDLRRESNPVEVEYHKDSLEDRILDGKEEHELT